MGFKLGIEPTSLHKCGPEAQSVIFFPFRDCETETLQLLMMLNQITFAEHWVKCTQTSTI